MIYQLEKHIADKLIEFFNQFNFIDKVVIFGSRAKHNANPKSDIDLCIYSLEMTSQEFSKLKYEIDELPILQQIDIVHFESVKDELRNNIDKDGKLLYVKKLDFNMYFKNISSKSYQISKDNYLSNGDYPVIDQGQKYIVGYSNDESKVYKTKTPIIIFGDHTRIIKYVDFDFIIGADGTKVLTVDEKKTLPKYAYYQLLNTKIESLGYSRHFKLLKEKVFINPSLPKQKKIVDTLDKASELIELRKESIKKLDELSKSIFIDMFGNSITNDKNWDSNILKKITTKIGSGATPRGGKDTYKEGGISLIRSLNIHDNQFKYKDLAFIDQEQADGLSNVIIEENDVLLNITGASVCRCSIVPIYVLPARVNQHVSILRAKKGVLNPIFLLHLLISEYKQKLMHIATSGGATREALTKDDIESLKVIVPPIELQNQFAKKIEKIEEQKALYEKQLKKLQYNFDALLAKSFEG